MAKILIIDDERSIRNTLKDILEFEKHQIVLAENGKIGLEAAQSTSFDVIFSDIKMPEMDGIQALKKIRESDPNAAIIMCSAMGQQAMVIESIQSGAKDFIVKPFQADRVIEAVRKVVG